jgi:murein DD-endopeptidase MepM/ murein hydrolase activator NlpD
VLVANRSPSGSRRAAEVVGGLSTGGSSFGRWRGAPNASWLARLIVAAFSLLGTTLVVVAASPGTASAGLGSDRATVRQLELRITDEGALAQTLVSRYDLVDGHMVVIDKQIAATRARLVGDRRAETVAGLQLRSLAIDAYVYLNASSTTPVSVLGGSDTVTLPEQEVYLGVVGGSLNAAVTALQVAQERTAVTEGVLRSERAETAATLDRLVSARAVAESAIRTDGTILSRVKGNIQALITTAYEESEAVEDAEAEEQEAQQQRADQALDPPSPPPAPPPAPPAPPRATGSYENPLRGASDLVPERIDQGVDYCGFGPIYAVGDGVVLSTVNYGWPGNTFIVYRLTDGPASGLAVYVAEDLYPDVQIGQTVTPATVLGQMYEGPNGIEMGWSDPSGDGNTMAADNEQFSGANSTAFGYNFSQLLESVGAPGGVLQNDPATGYLPSGWPQW